MSKLKTFLKRLIAVVLIYFCFRTVNVGVVILIHADSFVDIIKSLILTAVGGGGSYFAIEDFKQNKWPFED